jgi:ATP-binding cassette, subfamily B, bacterial
LSVLFQTPVSYDATARENISMGDVGAQPALTDIQIAARASGAHEVLSKLPEGYETRLGKCFPDGTELSAGEWQRVAMARAFLRKASIILLDEPTSFMDSWSELEWFDRLRSLARSRTCLMITHRFTIAMRADWIHVVRDGRVIESGSHDMLVRRDGFYAESWRDQIAAAGSGHDHAQAGTAV